MKKIDAALAHRLLYPEVPALFCASSAGRVSAMPVVSFTSLSSRPPLVGVSCESSSFTMKLASASRVFTLCLLDENLASSVSFLASHSGAGTKDKLAAAGLRHRPGRKVSAPVVLESVAVLECSLHSRKRFGDHVLLVGRVEAAYASADFRKYWRFKKYRPILYAGWQGGLSTYHDLRRRT